METSKLSGTIEVKTLFFTKENTWYTLPAGTIILTDENHPYTLDKDTAVQIQNPVQVQPR